MAAPIDAIVLAAGLSTRAGEHNKLLLPLAGKPLIAHAVDAALGSRVRQVYVVTGHEADKLTDALADRALKFVHNPNYTKGMSSSIKSGIRSLPADTEGVILCLGDMPLVASNNLDLLIGKFVADSACALYYRERRGNPVLFPSALFQDLLQLSGDSGARDLLTHLADSIVRVNVNDEGIFFNVNRPADL